MVPRILISPNAFKGTLSPTQAAHIIFDELKKFIPAKNISVCPLADGGDGTLDVLVSAFKGRYQTSIVKGPLGKSVGAKWGIATINRKKTAIIEMARASGLALVKGKNRILEATSFGTGQLIKAALNKKCRQIYIGVGGTATSDGGSGALQALGLRYLDSQKIFLTAAPNQLTALKAICWQNFDARLKKTKIIVLCDVRNPLLGTKGSAHTFGPQKGATPSQVRFLEKFLKTWSSFAKRQTKNNPGAGAAGALAFGLSAFAGGRLIQGAPFIMKTVGWHKQAKEKKWIITGEGRLDATSFSGKVVGAIRKNRRKAKILVICGSTPLSRRKTRRLSIYNVYQLGKKGHKNPKKALRLAVQHLKKDKKVKF